MKALFKFGEKETRNQLVDGKNHEKMANYKIQEEAVRSYNKVQSFNLYQN